MRLDSKDKFPSGMEDYLAANGWHFNKKMCDWAVGKMKKRSANGEKAEKVTPVTKDEVDQMLMKHGIVLDNEIGYDYVYVANMVKADAWRSSIEDEMHHARAIKDYVDDIDGYEEAPFTRFYSDCIGKGIPINWEDML